MSWLDALAAWTADLHPDLVYREAEPYGPEEFGVAVGPVPSRPLRCVALTSYGGGESDSLLGWDEPNVQWRVRGTPDERVSRRVAEALYDALHGAGPFTLPDGTRVQLIVCLQAGPITLGLDDEGRNEHTVNARVELRRVTTHRK